MYNSEYFLNIWVKKSSELFNEIDTLICLNLKRKTNDEMYMVSVSLFLEIDVPFLFVK